MSKVRRRNSVTRRRDSVTGTYESRERGQMSQNALPNTLPAVDQLGLSDGTKLVLEKLATALNRRSA